MKKPKTMKLGVEGNGGADYLELEVVSENLVKVSVGHCCVAIPEMVLPVEVITAIFSNWFDGINGNIEQGIRNAWGGNPSAAEQYIERYRKANEPDT